MKHIVLLGDSIFDSASYAGYDPEVPQPARIAGKIPSKTMAYGINAAINHFFHTGYKI